MGRGIICHPFRATPKHGSFTVFRNTVSDPNFNIPTLLCIYVDRAWTNKDVLISAQVSGGVIYRLDIKILITGRRRNGAVAGR